MNLTKEDIHSALAGQDAATRLIAQQLAQSGLNALPEAIKKLQEILSLANKLNSGISDIDEPHTADSIHKCEANGASLQ